jgi:predicted peptidase
MLRKIYLISSLFLIIGFGCNSQTIKEQQVSIQKNIPIQNYGKFAPYKFVSGSDTLNYQLLVPKLDSNKTYPLIVFFHGAGERGTDNQKQLTYIDTIFQAQWFQNKYPSFVLAPQCPPKKRWVEVDWSLTAVKQPAQASLPMALSLKLIDTLIKTFPIDTNRIYAIGLSMGGFAVWDALWRRADLFAHTSTLS